MYRMFWSGNAFEVIRVIRAVLIGGVSGGTQTPFPLGGACPCLSAWELGWAGRAYTQGCQVVALPMSVIN